MTAFEEKPVKQVLIGLSMFSYVFMLLVIASTISWIYYVAKAVEDGSIGENDGNGDGTGSVVTTVEAMYQGTVISVLLYLMFRHHFC